MMRCARFFVNQSDKVPNRFPHPIKYNTGNKRPHQIGDDAGETHSTRMRHGVRSTDCGHAAFVEIPEWRDTGVSIEPGPNHLADVLPS
jgi:hypothetical protein